MFLHRCRDTALQRHRSNPAWIYPYRRETPSPGGAYNYIPATPRLKMLITPRTNCSHTQPNARRTDFKRGPAVRYCTIHGWVGRKLDFSCLTSDIPLLTLIIVAESARHWVPFDRRSLLPFLKTKQPKPSGSHAGRALEHAGEVALIAKPGRQGNVS